MKKQSLVERIERYLRLKGEYICGGEIQKLAASIGFEPQNAGRRLREMVNEKILEVEYRKGQNKIPVAWYRYVPTEKIISSYERIGDKMVEVKQMQLI